MVDIPEHLLIRSAEARAKALGITVEQALAEMKGEAEPTVISKEPDVQVIDETPAPAAETPAPATTKTETPEEVEFAPEVKVTQRLLTVVKAKPIQKPKKRVHQPGIEPGAPVWQPSILPLNHWYRNVVL